ncbi:hypothetical protein RFI_07113 [Reticulomyxa filosa]|uniref:Uncharacterized protein n=1 Tax=Reticulomyxa filosa TaxID=46433 RepID=X6NXL0_RETFI|nr:hypothetical protein RFI_07113 [Reticulomyxa filosa]|eukprot:ETO30007.1 hypothetical protein RFI_07113 [Reticulomyxa filosa]
MGDNINSVIIYTNQSNVVSKGKQQDLKQIQLYNTEHQNLKQNCKYINWIKKQNESDYKAKLEIITCNHINKEIHDRQVKKEKEKFPERKTIFEEFLELIELVANEGLFWKTKEERDLLKQYNGNYYSKKQFLTEDGRKNYLEYPFTCRFLIEANCKKVVCMRCNYVVYIYHKQEKILILHCGHYLFNGCISKYFDKYLYKEYEKWEPNLKELHTGLATDGKAI